MSNLEAFKAPHVARGWFVYMDLPSGESRLHTGVGTIEVLGHSWLGISDPIGGTLAGVSAVDQPKFGVASVVQLSVSGVNEDFYADVFNQSDDIEGHIAEIYFAVIDQETGQFLMRPQRYIRGFLSSPKHSRPDKRSRMVSINVENIFFRANQPFTGTWNNASQQELFAGDKGLERVGYSGSEAIK